MFRNFGDNLLLIGAKQNTTKSIRTAIKEHSADLEAYGEKAMKLAIKNHSTAAILEIIEQGFDVNSRFKNGQTPLVYAIQQKSNDAIDKLLDAGADPNTIYKNNSPLYMATLNNNEDLVQKLISAGADLDYLNAKGVTAVCRAAKSGYTGVVHQLVKAGANVNIQFSDGSTALLWALYKRRSVDLVLDLARGGASLYATYNGYTVKGNAKIHGHVSFEQLQKAAKQGIEKTPAPTPKPARPNRAPASIKAQQDEQYTRAPAPDETFERLGKHILIHKVQDGKDFEMVTTFNFFIRSMTSIQFKSGEKIHEDKRLFSDFDDLETLRPAFNKLVNLGGAPCDINLVQTKPAAKPLPAPKKD